METRIGQVDSPVSDTIVTQLDLMEKEISEIERVLKINCLEAQEVPTQTDSLTIVRSCLKDYNSRISNIKKILDIISN